MNLRHLLRSSLVMAILLPLTALATLPAELNGEKLPTLSPMLQTVMPSVVNIISQGKIVSEEDPFSEPADTRGDEQKKPNGKSFESIGSGVVIDEKNGYILTNAHLITQADSITVTLNDGRRFKAKLIGKDIPSDIAVLHIKADNLAAIKLANSNALKVGDFVVAIGSPYGLDQTVTSGIVSAVKRSALGIEGYEDFIQTDASINPGNSGGALVDLHGNLVGINTAILAPNSGNVGIGFAIPINMAKSVADQLIEYGKVGRGIVGVMMQTLTPELANAFNEPDAKGAVITKVTPNSPAISAGLQAGDVIQAINGVEVETSNQVRNSIGLLRAGSTIDLKVLRNGKNTSITLKSAEPNAYQSILAKENPFFFGAILRDFDAQVPSFGHVQGVQLWRVTEDSPSWQAGLRGGDVILSADRKIIKNLSELNKASRAAKNTLLVNVIRGDGAGFFVIKS